MIRSVTDKKKESSSFPLLAENKTSEFVVLFLAKNKGIVLQAKLGLYEIGHSDSNWVSCFDNQIWRIFSKDESITLIQE